MIRKQELRQAHRAQAQLFKVLMHPTRLAILEVLRHEEQCVCHLEAALGLRQAHISQHLMVLRDAGLVADRRDGWNIFYRIARPEVLAITDAASQLDSLDVASHAYPLKIKDCPCPKCSPGSNCGLSIPNEGMKIEPGFPSEPASENSEARHNP